MCTHFSLFSIHTKETDWQKLAWESSKKLHQGMHQVEKKYHHEAKVSLLYSHPFNVFLALTRGQAFCSPSKNFCDCAITSIYKAHLVRAPLEPWNPTQLFSENIIPYRKLHGTLSKFLLTKSWLFCNKGNQILFNLRKTKYKNDNYILLG